MDGSSSYMSARSESEVSDDELEDRPQSSSTSIMMPLAPSSNLDATRCWLYRWGTGVTERTTTLWLPVSPSCTLPEEICLGCSNCVACLRGESCTIPHHQDMVKIYEITTTNILILRHRGTHDRPRRLAGRTRHCALALCWKLEKRIARLKTVQT